MPTYTIFAGVNGAGKTSIYKSIYYNENKDEKRINTDEIFKICDEVNIYDNTEVLREIMYLKNDEIIWRDKKIPNWANNIFQK